MKFVTTFLLLCLYSFSSFAQSSFVLNVKISDNELLPLASGEVLLLNTSDGSVVDKQNILDGKVVFSKLAAGIYTLKISASGFIDKTEQVDVSGNMQVQLKMDINPATLQQVTVTANRPPFSYRNGNIILNAESPTFAAIQDPMQMLSKIPSVQLSANGESLTVVGKGQPLIYINNQRASFDDVKSLAVSDINTIELINNPSSKYEAEGRVVLLIKTKINGKEGIKGEMSESVAVRKYVLNRASANASYKKRKVELKGSIQFNHLKTWEGNSFDFAIPSRNIYSGYLVTAVTSRLPQMIGNAGFFYQLNELDYVSVNTSGRAVTEVFPIYTTSYLKDDSRNENVLTSNFNREFERYGNGNINFNKGLKKLNANFFAGLQYTRFTTDLVSQVFNTYENTAQEHTNNRNVLTAIDVVGGRMDFEKKWKNDLKLEAGGTFSTANSGGQAYIFTFQPQQTFNTVYDYHEINSGAYTQVSGKRKKLDWSVGMRVETTDVNGDYKENEVRSGVDKNNIAWFPKAVLTYNVDSSRSVTVRYTKNINRPNYSNANQTVVYINPYFEWANNIDLDPSLYQEISATYQYKNYNLNAGFYVNRGAMNSNFVYDAQRGVLRRSELNFDHEKAIFVSATIPFKYKLWSSTNVMNVLYSKIEDETAVTGKSRPFVYLNTTNEFALPGQFTFTASAWAITRSYQGAFERNALYAVDTSLSKKMGKLTCAFRINDVFASVNAKERFTVNDVAADGMFYDNGREFSLSFKYAFGKLKESTFRNRDVDENSGRVK